MLLRDWLCTQLLPMSEQSVRRAGLRARVAVSLQHQLTGDPDADTARVDHAVEEQVLAVGRANVSRAISDLVRAGLVTRHYAGYATNHGTAAVGVMRSMWFGLSFSGRLGRLRQRRALFHPQQDVRASCSRPNLLI